MAIYNAQEFGEAKEESMIDNLTGLYNRRYFVDVLKNDLIKQVQKEKPLSLVRLEINVFKN